MHAALLQKCGRVQVAGAHAPGPPSSPPTTALTPALTLASVRGLGVVSFEHAAAPRQRLNKNPIVEACLIVFMSMSCLTAMMLSCLAHIEFHSSAECHT